MLRQELELRKAVITEGGASEDECAFLGELVRLHAPTRVMEIGFNAGFSSEAFLLASSNLVVTSFDIGENECVAEAKKVIDLAFPGRHELVIGDSVDTVPAYPGGDQQFDFAFVDGGHFNGVAFKDLRNSRRLLRPGGIIAMDDFYVPEGGEPMVMYQLEPTAAWKTAIKTGVIEQFGEKWFPGNRGIAWGRFTGVAPKTMKSDIR